MQHLTILSILLLLLAPSCKQHDLKQPLSLHNGAKWAVNAEMKPHIQQGEDALQQYRAAQSQNYQQLAAELQAANAALIESCTMKGKSHEVLHQWLHPHMQLVDSLGNAADAPAADAFVEKLAQSYEQYHRYFE